MLTLQSITNKPLRQIRVVLRTISVEEFHKVVVRPAGEFFSPESFADDAVIAENDDQFGAESQAENAAEFLGQGGEFLVELASDVRQVADER